MEGIRRDDERVVAIDPTSRGFGYAVLEGPALLVDWGVRDVGQANSQWTMKHVMALLGYYKPDVVVVEDVSHAASRRRGRTVELIEEISRLAEPNDVVVSRVPRIAVHRLFRDAEATNKHQIAHTIAMHFPELGPRLPPFRKPWMSEDSRMAIFDAVAFALAHYYFSNHETRSIHHDLSGRRR